MAGRKLAGEEEEEIQRLEAGGEFFEAIAAQRGAL
jgi:hypothetical protein